MVKIILRKTGVKKYKGWRIGMTVCRYSIQEEKPGEKEAKREKQKGGSHNLKRLLQQTSEYLQAPNVTDFERKLLIQPHEKFKESTYASEEVSALFFKWNPTEGPFIVIPSSDGEDRVFNYKLTVYSNNPVEMTRLDEQRNQTVIGKWQKDISAGGCHLNEKDSEPAHVTFLLILENLGQQPKIPHHLQVRWHPIPAGLTDKTETDPFNCIEKLEETEPKHSKRYDRALFPLKKVRKTDLYIRHCGQTNLLPSSEININVSQYWLRPTI